ncbi:MAG: hypothetical protein GXP09_00040 [Gammaproteobacteria bacterium]|nr:hypothetical protein [Gammaproteobacteria bacterium]
MTNGIYSSVAKTTQQPLTNSAVGSAHEVGSGSGAAFRVNSVQTDNRAQSQAGQGGVVTPSINERVLGEQSVNVGARLLIQSLNLAQQTSQELESDGTGTTEGDTPQPEAVSHPGIQAYQDTAELL